MTSFEWWAAQMPPGTFLCSLCFEGKPFTEAWIDAGGQVWDTCVPCQEADSEAVRRRDG